MAANFEARLPPPRMTDINTVLNPLPNAPSPPSQAEAMSRYYHLPSHPKFVARSSHNPWTTPPTDVELDAPDPKQLRCVGEHPLVDVWEGNVDIAMHEYLVAHGVQYTSLDPVRIGARSDAAPPVIVWVAVAPGSTSGKLGVEVAVGLRALLLANNITDVHVEIRESLVNPLAKMYKPVLSSQATFKVREPFSTTLGIPICAEDTPQRQGTATLFFTDPTKPGKLFLIVPKHVVFCVEKENTYFEDHKHAARKNVMICSNDGFEARIEDIEREIYGVRVRIDHLKQRLMAADEMEDLEVADAEREHAGGYLQKEERDIGPLEEFFREVKRDWKDPKNRVIGHVVYSPPLVHGFGKDKFTLDLAVVEVHPDKVDFTNFVGNAIDLGDLAIGKLNQLMHPVRFPYPAGRLLRLRETLSIDEMRSPSGTNVKRSGAPIRVLKRGCTSGLTVGCLNNVRSVLRQSFMTEPTEYSREFAVLARIARGKPFSEDGDSGSVVINSVGAVAGVVTSGSGILPVSDATYVTPIGFLLEHLREHGFEPNIFPVAGGALG